MSTNSQSASAEPNGALRPIFFSSSIPRSNISITAPTVAPNEIGSKPCSLQIMLAYCSASRSLTPFAAPSAQAASYSRPPDAPWYCGFCWTEKWSLSIFETRPQAMVHPKQAWLVTRCALPSLSRGLAIASAEISFALSNLTSLKFLVGRAPSSLITFINTWVPYVGRPSPVTAFSARTCFFSAVTFWNSAGLAMLPIP